MKIALPIPKQHLDDAFNLLMSEIEHEDAFFHKFPHQRRIRRDLPRQRSNATVPCMVTTYPPLQDTISTKNKHQLLLLSAFEASYHGNLTHKPGHGAISH
jgi:hypothetical protein